jgi:hypothetical protein
LRNWRDTAQFPESRDKLPHRSPAGTGKNGALRKWRGAAQFPEAGNKLAHRRQRLYAAR